MVFYLKKGKDLDWGRSDFEKFRKNPSSYRRGGKRGTKTNNTNSG